MAKRRRTKTKRTRMAKSIKISRSRTKKLRKKNKRGGSLNLSKGTVADQYRLMEEAIAAEHLRRKEEKLATEKLITELAEKRRTKRAQKGKPYLDEKKALETAMAQMKIDDKDYSPPIAKPLKFHSTKKPTSPSRRVEISEISQVNRYDEEQGLCEIHTEQAHCDEQSGCNWIVNKCLPSSEVMSTDEPTRGKPALNFLTDPEKVDKLLNEILKKDILDLKNRDKVFRFINTEDETNALIERINEMIDGTNPEIVSMGNCVFGTPEEVKMRHLKETLQSAIKSGWVNDEDDAF